MQAIGAAFIVAWTVLVSSLFFFIFSSLDRLRVNQVYEVIGLDSLMHLDFKEVLMKEKVNESKSPPTCFDPSLIKVSDFKCDSIIPALNEDSKRQLILTLEKNVKMLTSRNSSLHD